MIKNIIKKFQEKKKQAIYSMVEHDINTLTNICEKGFNSNKYWQGEYKLNNLNEDFLRKHNVSETKIIEYLQAYDITRDKVHKSLILK